MLEGRPKILWLARILPLPLNAGDRIYTAKLATALAKAGAYLHFTGLANPDDPKPDLSLLSDLIHWEEIPGRPRASISAIFSRRPIVGAKFGTETYSRRVKALLREQDWDAVVIDQYGMAWVLPLIARLSRERRPKIIHIAHDFETEVTKDIASNFRGNRLRRLALMLNARRTADAEVALAASAHLIVTLTEHDRKSFETIGAPSGGVVLPPGYDGVRTDHRVITRDSPRRIAIVGSYRWTAKQINLADFLRVADRRLKDAGIELAVVGDAPPAFIAEWQDKLQATRFLSFVEDLPLFLASCRMGLVIEAIGGGFKLKVLDYVFTRTPVAALDASLTGQSEYVTENFIKAPDAAALVEKIINKIDDIETLNAMQHHSYEAASPLYSWDRNGQTLLDRVQSLPTLS